MSTFTSSKTFKIIAVVAVFGVLFFGGFKVAKALTQNEVTAICALFNCSASQQAAMQALVTTSTPSTSTFSVSATEMSGLSKVAKGSSGASPLAWQKFLNDAGASPALVLDGNFGTKSVIALKAWQASQSLTADGIAGGMSRAAASAQIANAVVVDTTCVAPNTLVNNVCTAPSPTGPLSVALATDNPASSTVIETQAAADLLHIAFSGSGTVTNVKLNRTGISTSSTLSNVYLFDGSTRLTDAASVNSAGEISFNQPAGLFTVSGSKTVSVRADIADTTSGQTVGIAFASAMAGTTAISGTANGNMFSIAANPSTMSAVAFGTVTPTGATINPGANITLWQSNATISNNNVYLDRIAFRNVGSAPASAFANFKLFVGGVEVATATGLDSNGYVTFVPTSSVLMQSGTRIMRVDADVISGASRTVQLSLRTAADAGLRDQQLGVNVAGTGIPAVSATTNTISGTSGGTLTIEKDTSSPSQNITLNGTDVTLGKWKATAFGEAIKIETLPVGFTYVDTVDDNPAGAGSTATLRNGRIMIDGNQYGSTTTTVAAGTSFTLNYIVNPGTPAMIEFRADVFDNDGTGDISATDTILPSITIPGSANAVRQDSLGTFISPSTAVAANTLTVQSAAIDAVINSTYASQTTVLPQTGFKIGSWNLTGSSVEDVLISTLSIDVDESSGTEFDQGDITNMYIVVKDGANIVAQPAPLATLSTTGQDNNFSISYTLAKNKTVSVELFGTLSDDGLVEPGGAVDAIDAGDAVTTDLSVSGTSLVSGIAVADNDVAGQVVTAGAGTLTATVDATRPDAAILADNQTKTASVFKFAAVNAGFNVTDLVFTLPNASNVQSVMLKDGSTPVASLPGNTTVTFNGLSWNVPANTNKALTVELQLGTTGYANGTSGAEVTVTLTSGIAVNTATGTSAAITEANPAGTTQYVYAAIPTITNVNLPNGILANGTNTIAKFSIGSGGSGTIAWKQILLTINKTGGAADGSGTDPLISAPTLWNSDTGTQVTAAVEIGSADGDGVGTDTGTNCEELDTSCVILFSVGTNADDSVEEQISGTKNYEVRATVSGTLATGDNVFTNISQPSTFLAPDDYVAIAIAAAGTAALADVNPSFVWSDVSAQNHSTAAASTDWSNGFLVKNLPTSSQTLTK